jgi:hypothetical protein
MTNVTIGWPCTVAASKQMLNAPINRATIGFLITASGCLGTHRFLNFPKLRLAYHRQRLSVFGPQHAAVAKQQTKTVLNRRQTLY